METLLLQVAQIVQTSQSKLTLTINLSFVQ